MVFYKVLWWWPQVYSEVKEYEKCFNFKIFKVMFQTTFQTMCFSVSLLLISSQLQGNHLYCDMRRVSARDLARVEKSPRWAYQLKWANWAIMRQYVPWERALGT